MAIAGYQSDIALSDVLGDRNIPAQNNQGTYTRGASATGTPNDYLAVLDPPLTGSYPVGLRLEVQFETANTNEATLTVDEQEAIPLKKFDREGSLIPLSNGDLKTDVVYILVFDGQCFQVVTGIPLPTEIGQNRQEVLSILDENINLEDVFYVGNNNTYIVLNGNFVVPQNIRLRRVGGAGQLGGTASGGTVLKMPVPEGVGSLITWTTQSSEGNFFSCRLSGFGVLAIEGEFTSELDEVPINFPGYIAKTPIEFPQTPVFNPVP